MGSNESQDDFSKTPYESSLLWRVVFSQRKRFVLLRVGFCFILGVVMTVAIAWAGASMVGIQNARTIDSSVAGFQNDHVVSTAQHQTTTLRSRLIWTWFRESAAPEHTRGMESDEAFIDLLRSLPPAPRWSRIRQWPANNTGVAEHLKDRLGTESRIEDGWGLPFRSMIVVYGWDESKGGLVPVVPQSAIQLRGFNTGGGVFASLRALPLWMSWPGFVADAIVWGTRLFVVLFGWATARQVRRVRRGWCLQCGYDVRSQRAATVTSADATTTVDGEGIATGRCPECGAQF